MKNPEGPIFDPKDYVELHGENLGNVTSDLAEFGAHGVENRRESLGYAVDSLVHGKKVADQRADNAGEKAMNEEIARRAALHTAGRTEEDAKMVASTQKYGFNKLRETKTAQREQAEQE